MKIPNNYDANSTTGWTPVQPGGHKCVIKQVESKGKDRWGNDALIISFDMDIDDYQPQYFTNLWTNDKSADKEWKGMKAYRLDSDYIEMQQNKFCGAVEASNEGIKFVEGEEFPDEKFKGLKVGIVFRGRNYTKGDGSLGYTVDPYYFCNYDTAFNEKTPDVYDGTKKIETATATPQLTPSAGFVNVPAGADETEGLPFR